jgi:hypothetical protein
MLCVQKLVTLLLAASLFVSCIGNDEPPQPSNSIPEPEAISSDTFIGTWTTTNFNNTTYTLPNASMVLQRFAGDTVLKLNFNSADMTWGAGYNVVVDSSASSGITFFYASTRYNDQHRLTYFTVNDSIAYNNEHVGDTSKYNHFYGKK